MQFESPRFNQELNIKYIIIQTGYNNRAISNEECANIIKSSMELFNKIYLEDECNKIFQDYNYENYIYKKDKIYIIPSEQHIRLLYTKHSGYTWIDADKEYPIYTNGHTKKYVSNLTKKFNNIDNGSFVFELSEIFNFVFNDILQFANNLTKMNFCNCYDSSTLYDVRYYNDFNAIVFEYDCESG